MTEIYEHNSRVLTGQKKIVVVDSILNFTSKLFIKIKLKDLTSVDPYTTVIFVLRHFCG